MAFLTLRSENAGLETLALFRDSASKKNAGPSMDRNRRKEKACVSLCLLGAGDLEEPATLGGVVIETREP